MKFYISIDYTDKESRTALPLLIKFLKGKKVAFEIEKNDHKNSVAKSRNADMIIAFGSSFNILRTFRKNPQSDKPVLGVSVYGNEFLPEIKLEEFEEFFERITNGEYNTEKRNRIELMVDSKPFPPVLNEVVIAAKKSASTIIYSLYIDKKQMFKDEGDGIIISTPTGSTGYSASSGGPIVLQGSNVIALTPLSSMQQNKPMIVSDESEITIKNANSDGEIEIICDGRFRYPFKGKELTIKKYEIPARFVTINEIKKNPLEKLKSRGALKLIDLEKAPPSAKFIVKLLQYEGPLTQKDIIAISSLQIRTVRHGITYLKNKGLIEEQKSLRDARLSIYKLKNYQ